MRGVMLAGLAYLVWKLVTKQPLGGDAEKRAFVLAVWDAADASGKRVGWPRDLIITHAALESGWGRSQLAAKYHNLFGFKTGKAWLAEGKPHVYLPTKEHVPDEANPGQFKIITIKEPFRVYANWGESIDDVVRLLTSYPVYAGVDAAGKSGDAQAFFKALHDSPYSTHQEYDKLLAQTYEAVETAIV